MVVAIAMVTSCSSGGGSIRAFAEGAWSCDVDADRIASFEDDAEALESGYFTTFDVEIAFDDSRSGDFQMVIPNGASAGSHHGEWQLVDEDLSVEFDEVPNSASDSAMDDPRYAFGGVSNETDELRYDPTFDIEDGTIDVARQDERITLTWQGYDGGSSTGQWVAECAKQ